MYDNDIIEMEDFSFNHYIHHFDECDADHLLFNEEYSSLEIAIACIEEIIWG
ncbi:MAG: hypothetical protein PHU40_11990 [Sulfurimonas sp.]|nr:hypothetical protein [Sulfurimonas sp.]